MTEDAHMPFGPENHRYSLSNFRIRVWWSGVGPGRKGRRNYGSLASSAASFTGPAAAYVSSPAEIAEIHARTQSGCKMASVITTVKPPKTSRYGAYRSLGGAAA
jgi:hypothetical protein